MLACSIPGPPIHTDQSTIASRLSLAAARSNAPAVTLLLDAGADPTIRNHVGDLPIDTWIIDPHGSEPVYDRLKALTEERLASNVSANQ